jgi:hypothetical protein
MADKAAKTLGIDEQSKRVEAFSALLAPDAGKLQMSTFEQL